MEEIMTRVCPQCGRLLTRKVNEISACACGWEWDGSKLSWEEFCDYMESHRCKDCLIQIPRNNNINCMECFAQYYCDGKKK